MNNFREQTMKEDLENKKKTMTEGPQAPHGYENNLGPQDNLMDESAVEHECIEEAGENASQEDYTTESGGNFGTQTDQVDIKVAVISDEEQDRMGATNKKVTPTITKKSKTSLLRLRFENMAEESKKLSMDADHVSPGSSRNDRPLAKFRTFDELMGAVGSNGQEKVEKHASQVDGTLGYGGKFGLQADRVDKNAVGWDYQANLEKHESQVDHSKGFGGKFGVQSDRQDKAAVGFDEDQGHIGTNYEKDQPIIAEEGKASLLKSCFENLAEENKKSAMVSPKNVRPLDKIIYKFKTSVPSSTLDTERQIEALVEQVITNGTKKTSETGSCETNKENVQNFLQILKHKDPCVRVLAIRQLENASMKLNKNVLSIESLWRELSHLYKSDTKANRELPLLAAQHLLDGFNIELLDGDSNLVNLQWMEQVMNELCNRIDKRKQRIFVLSIMGVQSSEKSTIINTMFGIQMRTGAEKCTRGVNMQLLAVEGRKEYDYILILDTEGAPECHGLEGNEKTDNKMVTLSTVLADATIVVNSGENDSSIKEILPDILMAHQDSILAEDNGGRLSNMMFFIYNRTDAAQKEKLEAIFQSLLTNLGDAFNTVQNKIRPTTTDSLTQPKKDTPFRNLRLDASNSSESDIRILENGKEKLEDDIVNPAYTEALVEFVEHIHRRVTDPREENNGNKWKAVSMNQFGKYLAHVWDSMESDDFKSHLASTVEDTNYDRLEDEYKLCEHELSSAYHDEFGKVQKAMLRERCDERYETSYSVINYPVSLEAQVLLSKFQTSLQQEVNKKKNELDDRVKAILNQRGREKWKLQYEKRWKKYEENQRIHWKNLVKSSFNSLFIYDFQVKKLKSDMREKIRELFSSSAENTKEWTAEKKEEEFNRMYQEILDEAKSNEKNIDVDEKVSNSPYAKLIQESNKSEMMDYFMTASQGAGSTQLFICQIQTTLKNSLTEAFEKEMICLTINAIQHEKWLNNGKFMQIHIDLYLIELLEGGKVKQVLDLISKPKKLYRIVLRNLVAKKVPKVEQEYGRFAEALKIQIRQAISSASSTESGRAAYFIELLRDNCIKVLLSPHLGEQLLINCSGEYQDCGKQDPEDFRKNCENALIHTVDQVDRPLTEQKDFAKYLSTKVVECMKRQNDGASRPRCDASCPWCGSQCFDSDNHDTELKLHDTIHQPSGLNGVHFTNSLILRELACSKYQDTTELYRHDKKLGKFKDFETIFPGWRKPKWKESWPLREYIFATYQEDIVKHYQRSKVKACTDIPVEYKRELSTIRENLEREVQNFQL